MARDVPGSAGNYLSVGDVAAIDITGTALTIAAWIRPDSVTGNHYFVAKWPIANDTPQYLLWLGGAVFKVDVGAGSGFTFDEAGGGTVVTGAWQHVAGVKNGTGANALKAYLAGVEVASITSNVNIGNTSHPLTLGRMSDSDTGIFDGRIADVAIYNAALSAEEILALSKGVSPLLVRPGNLKGYWPLWGAAYPEIDMSGNSNNASQVGTVSAADHAPVGRPIPHAA